MNPVLVLGEASRTLRDYPRIVGVSTGYIVLLLFLTGIATPTLPLPLGLTILVALLPFLLGGLYEMILSATESQSISVSTFIDGGKARYTTVLGAYIISLLLVFAYLIAFILVGQVIVGIDHWFLSMSFLAWGAAGIGVLVIPLQFLDILLVAEDIRLRDARSALEKLWVATRHSFSSLLMYTTIRSFIPSIALLTTLPAMIVAGWVPDPTTRSIVFAIFGLGTAVSFGVVIALLLSYHVHWYKNATEAGFFSRDRSEAADKDE